jgi:NAD(P)-dependent dehydrogenase (short-subunit alcohol dehydrogenase family)
VPNWTVADLEDQTGRTVIITGASSGIGRTAAAALARKGARVVLAVRDTTKGAGVAAEMSGTTEVRHLDLADLVTVREFAASWTEPIDVLINNAGLMLVPRGRTADGFETHIGVNHLGHFALTNLLLPRIRDRVVTVASLAHRSGRIHVDDLNYEHRRYGRAGAYAQSKLANLLFTHELHRRLTTAGSPVRALAAHPGLAKTDLGTHTEHRILHPLFAAMSKAPVGLSQDPVAGGWPTLYAATADLPSNTYTGPAGFGEWRGEATVVKPTRKAQDARLARELWERSEALTNTAFPARG